MATLFKYISLVFFLIVFFNKTHSQNNLILNGSFEDPYTNDSLVKGKSFGWSYLEDYKLNKLYWPNIYRSGSDIFFEEPDTDVGYQQPVDGVSFAGIGMFYSEFEFRNYLIGNLVSKLENGVQYKISLYISLADCSGYSVDNIGISFSTTKQIMELSKKPWWMIPEELSPYFEIKNKELADTSQWKKIEGEFTAKGGEDIIIIGSFQPDNMSNIKKMNPNTCKSNGKEVLQNAYYFIDHVCLIKK